MSLPAIHQRRATLVGRAGSRGGLLPGWSLAAKHTLIAVDETHVAAGGDARKIAELLVGLVLRWELGFEKGRQTANAWRSSSVPVLLTFVS